MCGGCQSTKANFTNYPGIKLWPIVARVRGGREWGKFVATESQSFSAQANRWWRRSTLNESSFLTQQTKYMFSWCLPVIIFANAHRCYASHFVVTRVHMEYLCVPLLFECKCNIHVNSGRFVRTNVDTFASCALSQAASQIELHAPLLSPSAFSPISCCAS